MKIKIFVKQGACYSEDGDLSPYSTAYATLEEAKEALQLDYHENSRWDEGTEDEMIDEDAWIAKDGLSWGSRGPNQTFCEIVEREITI